MSFSPSISFFGLLTILIGFVGEVFAAEIPPLLAVKFTEKGVAFSGKVDSEETGLELAAAVKAVRPDLAILNEGLTIDSEAQLPALDDMKSLLAELGISTHEGGFAYWDDAILISGLTDSRITLTALKIRLEPLLGDRRLINRTCIVPSEDLPKISVKLSSGKTNGPLLDFDFYPSAVEVFETPGLPLAKLYPTMAMMSDLGQFEREDSAKPGETGPPAPLRAVPLMTSHSGPATGASPIPAAVLRAIPTGPMNTYVELESIRFGRSSFLLQANQKPIVEEIVKQMSEPPLAGHRILVKPVKSSGGSGAYGDYLSERRSSEVRKLLVDAGISAGRIAVQEMESSSPVDSGEVRIVVEIPPPEPSEDAEGENVERDEKAGAEAPGGEKEKDQDTEKEVEAGPADTASDQAVE